MNIADAGGFVDSFATVDVLQRHKSMTKLMVIVLFLGLGTIALSQSAQSPQPASNAPAAVVATPTYDATCATCHGPAMQGASGPPIYPYVRYHTNVEITEMIRSGHRAIAVPQPSETQLRDLLTELRGMAGTSPTMATAGFTGSRGGRGGNAPVGAPAPGGGGAGPGGGGRGGRGGSPVAPAPVTITLTDGRTLTGILGGQSEFDGTLLVDRRFHLLAREGDRWREKPIEPKSDWLSYNGGLMSDRYRSLDQINRSNVHELGVAWMFPLPNSPRLQVTPVVVDGIMYVTGWNEIHALDATTGRGLWSYSEPRTPGILSEAGSGANRGAAIGGDRVFMVTDQAHVLAFNRFTGEKLWETEMGPHELGYSATVAPLVIGDLVVQGISGGEEGLRGFLDAYHVATGQRAWRFYTVPKRGEPGSETWIGQAIEHGCGATWQQGSYDAELDTLYWGTGNPCPDYNGAERLGDNLYTSSLIALSGKTGQLKWHYQFSPHDTHDWDAAQPMVLADEMWRGQPRKLLLNANRNGMFYVFDRTDGKVLLVDKLSTKVTWHKGFTPDGKPIIDPASIATPEGVAVCPGGSGGANMPAVSYSSTDKLFYTLMSDSCSIFSAGVDPLSGNRWFGRGTSSQAAQQALNALRADYPGGYFVRAMDPFTGKKVWDVPAVAGHQGLMSTGGGLVFSGSVDGGLKVRDAKTGKTLWGINVAQTLSQAAPMTYMVGGRQYVALAGMTAGRATIVAYALPAR